MRIFEIKKRDFFVFIWFSTINRPIRSESDYVLTGSHGFQTVCISLQE